MSNRTVLVVDDDPAMRRLLRNCLESDGYRVIEAQTLAQTRHLLERNDVDLITLDLNLGAESGLDIARWVRATSQVPIIMLTGRDDVIDRVVGLEIGADDYVTKPFHVREVLARVRSVLRRFDGAGVPHRAGRPEASASDGGASYLFDGLVADPDRLELIDRDGRMAEMTAGDFALLLVFLRQPKRVLSRDVLMDRLKGVEWAPLDRTVDNQVARLRKRIERDPAEPQLIKTVRGVGYLFAADVERHVRG